MGSVGHDADIEGERRAAWTADVEQLDQDIAKIEREIRDAKAMRVAGGEAGLGKRKLEQMSALLACFQRMSFT